MKYFIGILVFLFLLTIAVFIFINSGIYNVSALEPESAVVEWIFETTMESSVKKRSSELNTPNLSSPGIIKNGAVEYKEMCEVCHGAPGVQLTEFAKGLNPPPPELVKYADDWTVEELFWITKNGIKMTGMPGWGKSHSDDEIWSIVAFTKELPKISKQGYLQLTAGKETKQSTSQEHRH